MDKIRKKGKDWSDNVNDGCVAISILCETSVVKAFSLIVGDLIFLPLPQDKQTYISYCLKV